VAPLAVTLAAGVVIGFGVALARAGEDRLPHGPRRRRRALGLQRSEAVAAGLRRMAIEQAELAIEELSASGDGDARRSVHEARKAIKRMRTIVRMQERRLGPGGCALEQQALRSVAARLAGARDAEVMLDTLEAVIEREPHKLAGRAGVTSLRLALAAERDRAAQLVLEPENLRAACDGLRGFRERAARWERGEERGLGATRHGVRRIYRRGRRRMRRAAAAGDMRTMHQWRKRVKDLRYAAEAIAPVGAEPLPGTPRKRRRLARAQARRLRLVARRADKLGELLGEDHDLAVLGEWIDAHGAGAGAGKGTRKRLGKAISRRRRKLRRRALREGAELYRRSPKRFVECAEKACRRSRVLG